MDDLTNSIKQSLQQANQYKTELHVYIGIPNISEIKEGDNIGKILLKMTQGIIEIEDKDILIIASKIISKAEGNIINLNNITPSSEAYDLSKKSGKDPRICQIILNESVSYFVENGTIIAWHKKGFRLTSAGVDKIDSNFVATIPNNPDASARQIMNYIKNETGKNVAIIIIDSEGRADRGGAGSIALGIAGIQPLRIKQYKSSDGQMKETEETLSDLLAGGASVIIGQRGKGIPVVMVKGVEFLFDEKASMASIIHHYKE